MVVCNSGICMYIGVCTVQVLLDGVCYVVACVGLLSASLSKCFDVILPFVCRRRHND